MTIVGPTPRVLPPRTRRGVIAELIRVVADERASGDAPVAPSVRAALRSAARVVVFTDLLGDADDMLRAAGEGVAAGRDVQLLHVIAREELDPTTDTAIVQDPEQATLRRPLTPTARAEYLRGFAAWREDVARRWLASGAAYRVVVTDAEPAAHAIRRIARDEPMLTPPDANA